MIRMMARAGIWLGVTADSADADKPGRIPMWNGVRPATKIMWAATWILVGIAVFTVAGIRMPEEDGFGGFIPLYLAVFSTVAGIAVTERTLVNSSTSRKNRPSGP